MIRAVRHRVRRGLTLVELLVAISITAIVGVGIASMMEMVSDSEVQDRDARSALLRAHTAQMRLRALLGDALNILAWDANQGMAIWLHDQKPMDNVHPTELRILWWDDVAQTLTLELVEFPPGWPALLVDSFDTPLPRSSNWFNAMLAARTQGHTTQDVLLDGVVSVTASFNEATPTESDATILTIELAAGQSSTTPLMLTFPLPNHREPAR